MKWSEVAADWPAFTDSVIARWPDADPERIADLGGDQAAFVRYIAEVSGAEPQAAAADVKDWLEGPKPLDAVTHATHDGTSIHASARHIPPGEDVYSEDRDFGDDDLATNPVGRTDTSTEN